MKQKYTIQNKTKDVSLAINEGGDVHWDSDRYKSSDRQGRKKMRREFFVEARERREIEMIYKGVDLAPAATVVRAPLRHRPWTLPNNFDVDIFGPDELNAAVKLGILTVDVLTSKQREKLLQRSGKKMSARAAEKVLSILAEAYDK